MEGGFSLLLSCPLCPGYYSFYQMTDHKEPIQSRDTQSRAKQEGRGIRKGRTLGVYKKVPPLEPLYSLDGRCLLE